MTRETTVYILCKAHDALTRILENYFTSVDKSITQCDVVGVLNSVAPVFVHRMLSPPSPRAFDSRVYESDYGIIAVISPPYVFDGQRIPPDFDIDGNSFRFSAGKQHPVRYEHGSTFAQRIDGPPVRLFLGSRLFDLCSLYRDPELRLLERINPEILQQHLARIAELEETMKRERGFRSRRKRFPTLESVVSFLRK